MADYDSELPVRSQYPGQVNPDDVIIKIGDGTNPTTQIAIVDVNGNLHVLSASNGSVTPGTVAAYSDLVGGQYNSTPPTLTDGQQVSLQVDANGRLLVDATVIFPYDENWGTVGATTLRTASQIGNATGAADFNWGTVGAQTLRVAAEIGNATGAADFGAGATDAQTLRTTSNQGTPNTIGNAWPVLLTDGTNTASITAAGEIKVDITEPLPAGTNNIGSVNQGTSPWIVKDLADGSVTGGTAGTFSQLAGGIYDSTPPTLTNGQQAALQLDSSGRLLVDAAVTFPYDENWGTVGANTLRTAAEIGNATGAADFNWGTVGAQTLRVAAEIGNATGAADFGAGATDAQTLRTTSNQGAPNTAANAWPISITSGGAVNSPTNPVYVSADTVAGTPINDFKNASAIAAGSSDNHYYTVSAGKTLYLDQVESTASGKAKMHIEIETGVATNVFNTVFVQFNSTADTNMSVLLSDPIAVAAGVRVLVVMDNNDVASMDLYSTICGHEI